MMKKFFAAALLLLFAVTPDMVLAAGWRVVPIRLDFNQRARSGVITLVNDSDQKITFSLNASEWTQDSEGKDRYSPTSDLIFFPKVLTIDPHKERVIRAGIKRPPIQQEKTYRLFIKEVPPRRKNSGTTVAIAIRFGVPIFAAPLVKTTRGRIEHLELKNGELGFTVKNAGNVYFRIKTIHVAGESSRPGEIFSKDLNGWYLLNGASRPYMVKIPPDVCGKLINLDVQVKTDHGDFNGKIDVNQAACHSH